LNLKPQALKNAILRLIHSPNRAITLSENASKICDGKGAGRVAEKIILKNQKSVA